MTPPETSAILPRRGPTSCAVDVFDEPHSRPGRGPIATVRKYSKIFRPRWSSGWPTGATSCFGTILRFLPMVTTILLWQGDLRRFGAGSAARRRGFRYDEMIAYLLLVNISRMFSSMPNLAGGIARDIREGHAEALHDPAARHDRLPAVLPGGAQGGVHRHLGLDPYALLFFLCRGYFHGLPRRPDLRGLSALAGPGVRWSASSSRRASGWWGSGSWKSRRSSTS